ncbi:MAG: hypothetical protein KIC38_10625 [Actinomycetaceae bacterium]|jgi:hypothetical protein|nr:hypothetical protein [Actinomycetaceae bacterium]
MADDAFEISVDDLIRDAHAEAPEVKIGDVVLRNFLRLSNSERSEFSELLDKVSDDEGGADDGGKTIQMVADLIRLASDDKTAAEELIKTIGEDLSVATYIAKLYFDKSQPGEAKPSQD